VPSNERVLLLNLQDVSRVAQALAPARNYAQTHLVTLDPVGSLMEKERSTPISTVVVQAPGVASTAPASPGRNPAISGTYRRVSKFVVHTYLAKYDV
jgi:hypothetical protein